VPEQIEGVEQEETSLDEFGLRIEEEHRAGGGGGGGGGRGEGEDGEEGGRGELDIEMASSTSSSSLPSFSKKPSSRGNSAV